MKKDFNISEKNTEKRKWLQLTAIVLTAFNLRAALTGVGPLSGMIQQELGLSAGAAGFITTIPLLAFAFLSPFVSRVSAKAGEGRTMTAAFVIMAAGLLLRSYGGMAGLFAGTLLAGAGITFGNVLLPALVKDWFPERESVLTGVYTSSMSIFASAAAAVSIPLASVFGWRNALAVWALLAAAGIIVFLPLRSARLKSLSPGTAGGSAALLRHPVVICLAVYMGLQSLFYYGFVAWLPSILESRGFDAAQAGYWASIFQMIGIPVAFLTPIAAGRRDQRKAAMAVSAIYAAGLLLLLLGADRSALIAGVILCGVCASATFSLSMVMIGARAGDPSVAAGLSGVTQSAGYLLAAAGPSAMGLLFDLFGNWTGGLIALLVILVPMTLAGWQAARDRKI